jgi:hypothetical protein
MVRGGTPDRRQRHIGASDRVVSSSSRKTLTGIRFVSGLTLGLPVLPVLPVLLVLAAGRIDRCEVSGCFDRKCRIGRWPLLSHTASHAS